jgi:hypothetical protein
MNPGAAVPDPLALPLHETAIVATAVITFAGIVRWFQAQRHLTAGNSTPWITSVASPTCLKRAVAAVFDVRKHIKKGSGDKQICSWRRK